MYKLFLNGSLADLKLMIDLAPPQGELSAKPTERGNNVTQRTNNRERKN